MPYIDGQSALQFCNNADEVADRRDKQDSRKTEEKAPLSRRTGGIVYFDETARHILVALSELDAERVIGAA
jgi:hypothetical protein